jgi:hypothetical protein
MEWQSESIKELMAAMVMAQATMVPAKKDKENPFFHSRYADLSTVWEALEPFREQAIVLTQCPMESPDGYILLDTQLTHAPSGEWMRSRLKLRVGKDDPQGAGSALTYARRYALGCMTGLVTEEDADANAASPQPTTKSFAQKFPEQHRAIQAKLAPVPHGAVLEPTAKEVLKDMGIASSEGTLAPSGAYLVKVGRQKNQPVTDQHDDNLDWCLGYYLDKLNAPANATSRYREEWETAVIEIRGEQLARYPAEMVK